MNVFLIPTRHDLPWFKYKISLSNVLYVLHFRYNSRSDRWILQINDSTDTPLLCGIPLLILRNLTGQYRTLAIPAGVFYALDDTNKDTQATLFSFGVDHSLVYEDTLT